MKYVCAMYFLEFAMKNNYWFFVEIFIINVFIYKVLCLLFLKKLNY